MDRGTTLADFLPKDVVADVVTSVVEEGDVFRMKLDAREGIVGKNGAESRNKYFIIIGHDSQGNALGFFVVATVVNPCLPLARREKHLKLAAAKYAFLGGVDRYVNCSDFKIIQKERFVELFSADKAKSKIEAEDIARIKQEAVTYKNANKIRLKRFGLLSE